MLTTADNALRRHWTRESNASKKKTMVKALLSVRSVTVMCAAATQRNFTHVGRHERDTYVSEKQ